MTTPTPHGAPELPAMPSNISHITRRIRACESEVPAQLVLEHAMREYARAAIKQAAGAVPEGLIACLRGGAQCDEDGTNIIMNREACCVAADILERLSPLGREAGSSDHLVPCDGGGVTQPAPVDGCGCATCKPMDWLKSGTVRMILCATCGNKRCPHANDHRNACTGSNEPGQPGSSYPRLELCRHSNANCLVCRNGIHRRPDAPTSQIEKAPADPSGYHDPERIAAWNAANPDSVTAPREDGHG